MSYSSVETSGSEAYPNEIYTFTRQGNVWRYTSSDEDKVAESFVYTAVPLQRGRIEQTQEMARAALDLKFAKNVPFLDQYRSTPPTSITTVLVRRYHEGLAEYVTIWLGRVVNVKFGERDASVRCEPTYTSLKRAVLRRRYQTGCPHVLYGAACGVVRSTKALPVTLNGVTGTVLSAAAFGDYTANYFAGGYVDWENGPDVTRRFIVSSAGTTITLGLPFAGIPANAEVTVYPGCDHTLSTCHNKFNNAVNYGGQPWATGVNPFDGTPIF